MNRRYTLVWAARIIICGFLAFISMRVTVQEALPSDPMARSFVDVAGRVLDEKGAPLPGVEIRGFYLEERLGAFQHLTTTTDADGAYELNDIPVDAASVMYFVPIQAVLDGYAIAQHNIRVATVPLPERDGTNIERVDFTLHPAQSARILIVDPTHRPLQHVCLHSMQSQAPLESKYWSLGEHGLRDLRSDERGLLTIPGLEAGMSYDLNLAHPDYAQTPAWKVTPGAVPIEVIMDPGIEVEFIVTCESDPSAVSRAVVTANISEEGGHQSLRFPIDASGKTAVRLRDKIAEIRIEHPSLHGTPWYFFRPELKQMEFRLLRAGTVSGRVVDAATGRGVAEVWVQFAAEHRVLGQSRTDENGEYQTVIAEGSYTVGINDDTGRWNRSDDRLPVEVKADEETVIPDLKASGKLPLRGQVVLSNGETVPGAIVSHGLLRDSVICDQEGRFEVQPGTLPWTTLTALHPRQRLSRVVAIQKGTPEVVVELEEEGFVVGLVTDEQGTLLANIPLCLEASLRLGRGGRTSTTLQRFASRDDGTFRLVGLSPGYEYRVLVSGKSKSSFSRSRNEAGNSAFQISGPQPERKAIKVHDELLNEVRDLARFIAPAPSGLLPMDKGTWLREIDGPASEGEPDRRKTLLYFLQSTHALDELKSVLKLYGDEIRVVLIVPEVPYYANSTKLGAELLQTLSCPILIDNPRADLVRGYRIGRGPNDMPVGLLFSASNQYISTIDQHETLLERIRHAVLYAE